MAGVRKKKVAVLGESGAPADGVVQHVALAHVIVNRTFGNDREDFEPEAMQELADSIAAQGLAQPPTLRPVDKANEHGACRACGQAAAECACPDVLLEVVAGDRRTRAVRMLGWETMPAFVRSLNDEAAADIMLLENVQRRDLNPVEEAKAYRKRIDKFGYSESEIAKHAKRPIAHVRARLALLDLDPEIQKIVAGGRLPVSHAQELARVEHAAQRRLASILSKRPVSLFDLQYMVSQLLCADAQEALFEMADDFEEKATAQVVWTGRDAAIPFEAASQWTLPPVRVGRTDTVGMVLHRYMNDLVNADRNDEACAVFAVYRAMVDSSMFNVGYDLMGGVREPQA